MCGVAGVLGHRGGDLAGIVGEMASRIRYRGPDDSWVWCDAQAGVGLGHARLSILDLSPTGKQPMVSASGRYVVVFNGEIYNHLEIRRQLGGIWRGHSDTETLLASIERWGIEKTLRALTGMFAFAVWDRLEECLTLARDRIGEKPLYYGWCGRTFLFGSELKALKAHPEWTGHIDPGALACYMRYAYVPLPYSIYAGIQKLRPGTFLVISTRNRAAVPEPQPYWSALDAANQPVWREARETEAADALEGMLKNSIKDQMVADVPLGAFLSGGIDSSTVVALMQAQSSQPIRTFSIGFQEADYNEAKHAKAVASHLGTHHSELYVTPADALAVIPQLPTIYDEPFADTSGIPTYLVAQLARQHVTVALSGDGGDELFGGYHRYFMGPSIWRRIQFMPANVRTLIGRALTVLSPNLWDQLGSLVHGTMPAKLRIRALGDKIHKLAGVIDVADQAELYRRLISQHREPGSLVIGAKEPAIWADAQAARLKRQDVSEQMMFHDLVGYLTDDILTKVDRAAMAVSLETRVPMLDHKIVEFSWRLPLHMKIRHGQGKWLLRQVLYRHVPKTIIERPKMGFGVPLEAWLRGPLREWAQELLDESRLRSEACFHVEPILKKWKEHLSGRRNWQYWLWNVLMFQAWREHSA
jgi:asparagine synthase (glutamine-hydrolysing)